MVIFSHRGIGFGKKENSLKAFRLAVSQGYSIEADLRLKGDKVILAHDNNGKELEGFVILLRLIKESPNIFFALHLKEDKVELFTKIARAIQPFTNAFIFVTDFEQHNFLNTASKLLKPKQLALYVTSEQIDAFFANVVDYFWLDETKQRLYSKLYALRGFNKKFILCSPELFKYRYKRSLLGFEKIVRGNQKPFGICTDFCFNYT